MPFTPSFHSVKDETAKSRQDRVYHNNSDCRLGQGIAGLDRRPSAGGHHLCADCESLNSRDLVRRF